MVSFLLLDALSRRGVAWRDEKFNEKLTSLLTLPKSGLLFQDSIERPFRWPPQPPSQPSRAHFALLTVSHLLLVTTSSKSESHGRSDTGSLWLLGDASITRTN